MDDAARIVEQGEAMSDARGANWSIQTADAATWLRAQADDSIDLLFTSPPYELARTYGIGKQMMGGQAWVDWMVEVVTAASPKVRGLIAIVCEGQTRKFKYTATPFLLMADLHRAGFNLRKPAVFHRVGIPGSGGPDWLRNDWEPIVCVTRGGKLPWSDNTACGHPPKWAPGGEMSHRVSNGTRVNQWGRIGGPNGMGNKDANGEAEPTERPSHKEVPKWLRPGMHTGVQSKVRNPKPNTKKMYSRNPNGTRDEDEHYEPPTLANPGNVLKYDVGGGMMGHDIAHENEAPFPLKLAAFFVQSFCPPGGTVCDPFSGSGTTAHAAIEHRRKFVGCDVRESQVELARRRLATITPGMFADVSA